MKKKIFYTGLWIVIVFLIYLVFANGETRFSGENENEKLKSGLSRNTVVQDENSLFESGNFLDFSKSEVAENSEMDSGSNEVSSEAAEGGYSSLSPEEKERLRKEVIQKVKPLADRFPNNSMIPRELTKEEEEKRRKDEERMSEIRAALLEGREVEKPEMKFYLDSKIKRSNDMEEILEYSLKFFKDSQKNFPDSSLKIIQERLQVIQKSREELVQVKKNLDKGE
ncbi:LIC_20245 family lipoprotein [Leptospira stimsonii]|uniref:Uncharacterized protein n=1 Tax=Leptospira stimsonii TaxID=2202203 RepID=A0ABY2N1P9_9LEPT|nr:hypothetical protein [Leptospira stimsonii]TGK20568.1 hypothetical protein EHO98_08975 [Leptospira stimsonii]TGM14357.1 hypothetical protein EHQ90_12170 [Leptospira stimsonii]